MARPAIPNAPLIRIMTKRSCALHPSSTTYTPGPRRRAPFPARERRTGHSRARLGHAPAGASGRRKGTAGGVGGSQSGQDHVEGGQLRRGEIGDGGRRPVDDLVGAGGCFQSCVGDRRRANLVPECRWLRVERVGEVAGQGVCGGDGAGHPCGWLLCVHGRRLARPRCVR